MPSSARNIADGLRDMEPNGTAAANRVMRTNAVPGPAEFTMATTTRMPVATPSGVSRNWLTGC